jgi:hypothetical protein
MKRTVFSYFLHYLLIRQARIEKLTLLRLLPVDIARLWICVSLGIGLHCRESEQNDGNRGAEMHVLTLVSRPLSLAHFARRSDGSTRAAGSGGQALLVTAKFVAVLLVP